MYQDYLDIDIEDDETNDRVNLHVDRMGAGIVHQTVDLNSDDDNQMDEEIVESKNEFQRKKPNSVAGILGREGGMMKKQQVTSQINNFLDQ